MRLTIRRAGSLRRVSLVDELARERKEKQALYRRVLKAEAEASLARSSANEWRDRYHNLRQSTPVGWMASS